MRSNAKQVFKRLQSKFDQVKKEAPIILQNEGTRFFTENFRKKSWNDVPWKQRARGNKSHNPLLVGKTRRLINSVNRSAREANITRIKWATDIPYAQIHNDGGTIHVRAHQKTVGFRKKRGEYRYVFAKIGAKKRGATLANDYTIPAHDVKMPKRRFMGVNQKFKDRLRNKFLALYRRIK